MQRSRLYRSAVCEERGAAACAAEVTQASRCGVLFQKVNRAYAKRLRKLMQRDHGRIAAAALETADILRLMPQRSASRSCVQPFFSLNRRTFEPTSLRMSMPTDLPDVARRVYHL